MNGFTDIAVPHHATAFDRGEGMEEVEKGPIPNYILEGISLTEGGEKSRMNELRKLGFLCSGYLLVLAMLRTGAVD